MKLNFVIIGTEKAGTSYLVKILNSSGKIYLPKSEISIFQNPDFKKCSNIKKYFLSIFPKKNKNLILGIKRHHEEWQLTDRSQMIYVIGRPLRPVRLKLLLGLAIAVLWRWRFPQCNSDVPITGILPAI